MNNLKVLFNESKQMKTNIGKADKIIRLIIAAIIVTLYFTNVVTGTLGIVLLVVAAIVTLTALINFCPIYLPFGIKTCKIKEDK